MKCTISVEKFKKALAAVETLSRKGVLLSVLEKVYVAASGNTLMFYTTNLRSSVFYTVPARVVDEGELLCDGGRILQALQHVKDEQCDCTVDGGILHVVTSQVTVDVPLYPKDDFPVPQENTSVNGMQLTVRDFTAMVDGVSFAAAAGEAHPELGNVFIRTTEGNCVAAATDSFRLAETKTKGSHDMFSDGVLVPQPLLAMLTKIMQSFDEKAQCTLSVIDSTLQCTLENLVVRIQLAQGSFPEYERIMPKSTATECVISTSELLSSFKLCGAFSDLFHKVKITIDPKAGTCTIASQNQGSGSATVVVRAQVKGEALECMVNAGYIIPFLQRAHTDTIAITSEGNQKPLLMVPHAGKDYRYIIMPISG